MEEALRRLSMESVQTTGGQQRRQQKRKLSRSASPRGSRGTGGGLPGSGSAVPTFPRGPRGSGGGGGGGGVLSTLAAMAGYKALSDEQVLRHLPANTASGAGASGGTGGRTAVVPAAPAVPGRSKHRAKRKRQPRTGMTPAELRKSFAAWVPASTAANSAPPAVDAEGRRKEAIAESANGASVSQPASKPSRWAKQRQRKRMKRRPESQSDNTAAGTEHTTARAPDLEPAPAGAPALPQSGPGSAGAVPNSGENTAAGSSVKPSVQALKRSKRAAKLREKRRLKRESRRQESESTKHQDETAGMGHSNVKGDNERKAEAASIMIGPGAEKRRRSYSDSTAVSESTIDVKINKEKQSVEGTKSHAVGNTDAPTRAGMSASAKRRANKKRLRLAARFDNLPPLADGETGEWRTLDSVIGEIEAGTGLEENATAAPSELKLEPDKGSNTGSTFKVGSDRKGRKKRRKTDWNWEGKRKTNSESHALKPTAANESEKTAESATRGPLPATGLSAAEVKEFQEMGMTSPDNVGKRRRKRTRKDRRTLRHETAKAASAATVAAINGAASVSNHDGCEEQPTGDCDEAEASKPTVKADGPMSEMKDATAETKETRPTSDVSEQPSDHKAELNSGPDAAATRTFLACDDSDSGSDRPADRRWWWRSSESSGAEQPGASRRASQEAAVSEKPLSGYARRRQRRRNAKIRQAAESLTKSTPEPTPAVSDGADAASAPDKASDPSPAEVPSQSPPGPTAEVTTQPPAADAAEPTQDGPAARREAKQKEKLRLLRERKRLARKEARAKARLAKRDDKALSEPEVGVQPNVDSIGKVEVKSVKFDDSKSAVLSSAAIPLAAAAIAAAGSDVSSELSTAPAAVVQAAVAAAAETFAKSLAAAAAAAAKEASTKSAQPAVKSSIPTRATTDASTVSASTTIETTPASAISNHVSVPSNTAAAPTTAPAAAPAAASTTAPAATSAATSDAAWKRRGKKRRLGPPVARPGKLLFGGTVTDPLNLASLESPDQPRDEAVKELVRSEPAAPQPAPASSEPPVSSPSAADHRTETDGGPGGVVRHDAGAVAVTAAGGTVVITESSVTAASPRKIDLSAATESSGARGQGGSQSDGAAESVETVESSEKLTQAHPPAEGAVTSAQLTEPVDNVENHKTDGNDVIFSIKTETAECKGLIEASETGSEVTGSTNIKIARAPESPSTNETASFKEESSAPVEPAQTTSPGGVTAPDGTNVQTKIDSTPVNGTNGTSVPDSNGTTTSSSCVSANVTTDANPASNATHADDVTPTSANADPEFDPRKARFQYGNYNRYYGYRNGAAPDTRLACLRPQWFRGLDVLDVGCNIGHVTLTVARDYGPRKCVGLDIDSSLIKIARKNVKHYREPKEDGEKTAGAANFPSNVSFVHSNFVLESDALLETVRPEFDTLLCLSITKWIHLNFGDAGLRRFLRRAYLCLRPGGRLLLEPQPWSSYLRYKKLTPKIAATFSELQLRPEEFPALLTELGFLPGQPVGLPEHSASGFTRQLMLFVKPGGSPNPVNTPAAPDRSAAPPANGCDATAPEAAAQGAETATEAATERAAESAEQPAEATAAGAAAALEKTVTDAGAAEEVAGSAEQTAAVMAAAAAGVASERAVQLAEEVTEATAAPETVVAAEGAGPAPPEGAADATEDTTSERNPGCEDGDAG